MFGKLTEKLRSVLATFKPGTTLTEKNIDSVIGPIKKAFLEADVEYSVVKHFIKKIQHDLIGEKLIKGVSPRDQLIKSIHDQLVSIFGEEPQSLKLPNKLSTILLCGLQGCGKTTQAAKLAFLLQKKPFERKVLIAACDLQRPAAIRQLEILCEQVECGFYTDGDCSPAVVAKNAKEFAFKNGYNTLIIDSAGRTHVDAALMDEMQEIYQATTPEEVLFVANAALGQEAASVAKNFHEKLSITGSILTMLDGSSRAGAAFSIVHHTGQPIKFEGIGEKIEDLRTFIPRSMADRILGYGDVINLVKKTEEQFEEDQMKRLEKKIRTSQFNLEDYLYCFAKIEKMGPIKNILQMLPSMGNISQLEKMSPEVQNTKAIIQSMTPNERKCREEFTPKRLNRIANGCGVSLENVRRLIKNFNKFKKFGKKIPQLQKLKNKLPPQMKDFSRFL